MERRSFLRNALMAVAISLVPKILQPIDPSEEAFAGRGSGIFKEVWTFPIEEWPVFNSFYDDYLNPTNNKQ